MNTMQTGPDDTRSSRSPQPGGGTTSSAGFHLEEYKAIRAKLEEHIKDMRQWELYSIVGFFGLLAWLTSQKPSPHLAVWFLPALIPMMLFLRTKAHNSRIKTLGNYIREVESYFLPQASPPDPGMPNGFEHHFSASGDGKSFELYNRVLYFAMLLVALLAPFVRRLG